MSQKCIFSRLVRLLVTNNNNITLSNYKKTAKGEAFSKRNSSKYIQYIGTQENEHIPNKGNNNNNNPSRELKCINFSVLHTAKYYFPPIHFHRIRARVYVCCWKRGRFVMFVCMIIP